MPEIRRATPILYLETLEPAFDLWQRLGFERKVEVPHGEGVGFAILETDRVEVMLQTLASARDDEARLASRLTAGRGVVYFEVADLAAIESVLRPEEVLVPRRSTPYGAQEVFATDPAGNVLGFAEFPRDAEGT